MDTDHDFTILIVLTAIVFLLVVCYLCIISCEALVSNGYFKRCKRKINTTVKSKSVGESGTIPLVEMHSPKNGVLSGSTNISSETNETSRRKRKLSTGYVEVLNTLYEPWTPGQPAKQTATSLQYVVECDVHVDFTRESLFGKSSTYSSDSARAKCLASDMDSTNRDSLFGKTSSNSDTARASGIPSDLDPINRDSLFGKTSSNSDTARASGIPSDLDPINRDSLFGKTSSNSDTARASGIPSDLDLINRDSLFRKTSSNSDTARASGIPSDLDPMTRDSFFGKMSSYSDTNKASVTSSDLDSMNRDSMFGKTSLNSVTTRSKVPSDMDSMTRDSVCEKTASTSSYSDPSRRSTFQSYLDPITRDSLHVRGEPSSCSQITGVSFGNTCTHPSSVSAYGGQMDLCKPQTDILFGNSSDTSRETDIPSGIDPVTRDRLLEHTSTHSCSRRTVCLQEHLRHKHTDSLLLNTPIYYNTSSANDSSSGMATGGVASAQPSSRRPVCADMRCKHPVCLLENTSMCSHTPRASDIPSDTTSRASDSVHDCILTRRPVCAQVDLRYKHTDSLLGNTSICSHTPRASGSSSDMDPMARDSLYKDNPTHSCSRRPVCAELDLRYKHTDSLLGNTSICSHTPRASDISSDTDPTGRDSVRGASTQPSSRTGSIKEVSMRHKSGDNVHQSIFTISDNSWFQDEWEYNPCYDSIYEVMK